MKRRSEHRKTPIYGECLRSKYAVERYDIIRERFYKA